MAGLITLLTDFGTHDAFVGIVKGVILSIDPSLRLVDLTHEIPPQAVDVGALVLRSAVPYFPAATVHLAVVDPGVGTARAPIAVRTERATLVGPDNGLLAPAAAALGGALAVHALDDPALWRQPVSRTFHGRDIFAPAAAHLAGGRPLSELGSPRDRLLPAALPTPTVTASAVRGVVVHVDRFGNLLTNIERAALDAFREHPLSVTLAEMVTVPLRATYGDVATGELVALWSSWDTIEIARRDGSAAAHLGVGRGARVVLTSG
ncbi:SAM-dependent chlorinase/fluorinase [bacterium]|nr:SAM-dependent chlorinase/fluorinase [bacterium]